MDDQNVEPGVDSLMFVMENHTLLTYLRIKLIERTLVAHSLACKNMLLIKHVKHVFRVIVYVPTVYQLPRECIIKSYSRTGAYHILLTQQSLDVVKQSHIAGSGVTIPQLLPKSSSIGLYYFAQ